MTPEVAVLTLRDLEYIVSVADNQSFRKAAEQCAVTQPALSAQIKKVEQSFDLEIFERGKKKTITTDAGEKIVEQCRVILDELETLGALARGSEKPLEGIFRLGIIDSISAYIMPHLRKPIKARLPSLELVIREGYSSELLDQLDQGKIDAAIVNIHDYDSKFHCIELFEEPFHLVYTEQSGLKKSQLNKITSLPVEEMLFLDKTNPITQYLSDRLKTEENYTHFQNITETSSIESLLFMVSAQDKLAFIPHFAARKHKKLDNNLKFKNYLKYGLNRKIGLVCRKNYIGIKSVELLGKLIQKKLSKILSEDFS